LGWGEFFIFATLMGFPAVFVAIEVAPKSTPTELVRGGAQNIIGSVACR
jgi:hypothetical protein